MAIANSPLAGWFAGVWKTPVALSVGQFILSGDVGHLVVNDGLMTIFFFVVGLEVKREIVHGELHDPMKALLPVFAAMGGVVMPATIFLALERGGPVSADGRFPWPPTSFLSWASSPCSSPASVPEGIPPRVRSAL